MAVSSITLPGRSGVAGVRRKALPAVDPLVLLLSRTSFGIRDNELQGARSRGFEATLEEQLEPDSLDDSVLDQALADNLGTLDLDVPALLAYSQIQGQLFLPLSELVAATIARQLFSRKQLFEVMVEYWSNHFSVYHPDGPIRYLKTYEDRTVIRRHALGRFRDLLTGSARSPAMLFYLDNFTNVVDGPNENYARELMELHALGVDGGYTETDVREVARAFTGWSINPRAADGFAFIGTRHDYEAKTVLGQTLPAGQGIEDGNTVLDLLASHPSTARFIATKLVRRFVADQAPAALVDQVAAVFSETDGDIPSLLRTIFHSDEFANSTDAKFKRPAELVISSLRATAASASGDYVRTISNQLSTMGQLPFQWSPPDGYPDGQDHWLNTSALLGRWNFGMALAERRLGSGLRIDEIALASNAATPTQLVDRLAERVLHRSLDATDRATLIDYASVGLDPDAVLAEDERRRTTVALVGVLLASDYFQYR